MPVAAHELAARRSRSDLGDFGVVMLRLTPVGATTGCGLLLDRVIHANLPRRARVSAPVPRRSGSPCRSAHRACRFRRADPKSRSRRTNRYAVQSDGPSPCGNRPRDWTHRPLSWPWALLHDRRDPRKRKIMDFVNDPRGRTLGPADWGKITERRRSRAARGRERAWRMFTVSRAPRRGAEPSSCLKIGTERREKSSARC